MDKYEETFETWDKVAKLYQDKFMDLDLYNDTYDAFCDALPNSNSTILEIGCGPGNITKYILGKRPDLKIEAIDISPQMIMLAKANVPTANFKVMDSREIDKLQTQYNAIMCGFCLPYLSESDCTKLISDCGKILTSDGILYLSFVEGESSQSGYQTGSSGDRTYFYYHDLEQISTQLKQQHFEQVKLFHKKFSKSNGTQETHTILIAKKIEIG
jgi:ubiquinone/menaquinone biosynthesis C-methylase UbiE